jgi:hypothetical protein
MTLLFQNDEDAADQVVVDAIICRHVRMLDDAGCLRLGSDKGNSVAHFLFINRFLALGLSKVLCIYQTSCCCQSCKPKVLPIDFWLLTICPVKLE